MHAELRRRGRNCGRHRVARLMRCNGLTVRHRRRYRVTTDSRHNLPVAENLLGRHFEVGAANRAWVADITYVPTAQGWLYLATVLDLGTRQVVGWSMGTTMERPGHPRAGDGDRALPAGSGSDPPLGPGEPVCQP